MSLKTLVIDYGMGNISSVKRSLEKCGAEVQVQERPENCQAADRVVLPGVGAFSDGIESLRQRGWFDAIHSFVREKKPLLGICLGMQLLAQKGFEGGEAQGLGLIPGKVIRLQPGAESYRIPHVGWNEVCIARPSPLFRDIPNGSDFYFVHSYHLEVEDPQWIAATTRYGYEFVSAVAANNIYGVQFHPEKSQQYGFQILKNFLKV